MKCDLCGKNNAKYKYYEVNSNSIKELNICGECAKKKGIDFTLKVSKSPTKNIICPGCGLKFSSFKKNNRLGCSECYNAFHSKLKVIFKQIQPDITNRGKKPIKDVRVLSMKKELRELQRNLEDYVNMEKYEEAVQIRNKIEEYQQKLKSISREND
ncbi:UvrB/UvrC motif-containing protein [candidate division WOR-3 bacterium]|nr:UvrB/UvrC motif-containing protein [candidate division WOR-3 bacterium]